MTEDLGEASACKGVETSLCRDDRNWSQWRRRPTLVNAESLDRTACHTRHRHPTTADLWCQCSDTMAGRSNTVCVGPRTGPNHSFSLPLEYIHRWILACIVSRRTCTSVNAGEAPDARLSLHFRISYLVRVALAFCVSYGAWSVCV